MFLIFLLQSLVPLFLHFLEQFLIVWQSFVIYDLSHLPLNPPPYDPIDRILLALNFLLPLGFSRIRMNSGMES